MDQMWLEVLQEVNEGLITNEQASQKLGISQSTFYKRKAKFIKDQKLFKEAVIVPDSNDIQPASIKIIKNGFEFEFSQQTDINLFKTLVGVFNDF